MVCSSVEAISIRFLVREKLEKNSSFFKFCVGVEDMRTIWTMSAVAERGHAVSCEQD